MRVSGWGFGLGVVLAGLAAAGCGNSSSSGPGGASGNASVAGSSSSAAGSSSGGAENSAGSNSGGGSAGSSAGGGGLSGLNLGNSLTEACMAYALAVCTRQAQCHGGSGAECLRTVTLSCPDLTSSPGSTRTVEGLHACAKTYQALPCEQLDADELPACVTPGTVPLGGACAFNSQCQSLSCGGEESCGFCVPSAREGEPCSSTTGICLGNLVCEDSKCTRSAGTAPGGDVKDVGGTCSTHSDCKPELHCHNGSTCAAYPTLGESCSVARTCRNDSYCELDGLTCKAYPALGQPCGVDGFTGVAGYCAGEARCSRTSIGVGTCVELPIVGQACLIDPETLMPDYLPCALTARCDATQAPPRCTARATKGQACGTAQDCTAGLSCLCPDGKSTCTARVCGELRLRDQACGAGGEICHPGFSCTAGKCQPRDSQGLFDELCPNAP
jgi:hypothetical protein